MRFRGRSIVLAIAVLVMPSRAVLLTADAQIEILEGAAEWISDWAMENGPRFLFEYAVRKGLDAGWSSATDTSNTRDTVRDVAELKQLLLKVAERDQANAAVLNELRQNISRERINREELKTLLKAALIRMDARYAKIIELLEKQHDELKEMSSQLNLTARELGNIRVELDRVSRRQTIQTREFDSLKRRQTVQASEINRVASDLAEIKRWWSPNEQAVRLAIAGMNYLRQREYANAVDVFKKAHAYEERDPGILYGLAMAYKLAGDDENAEKALTRGIGCEKLGRPGKWYASAMERQQHEARSWLEKGRRDPIHGVYASGEIRVPQSLTQR